MAFIIIVIAPIAMMIGKSLWHEGALSLTNYVGIFSDTRQVSLFFKSLHLAFFTTLLSILMGVPLAFVATRTDIPWRKLWLWVYLLPLLIPPYIHSLTWISLLGTRGILYRFLGIENSFFNIYSVTGSSFILAFSYFPFVTLLAVSGLYSIDHRYEEASNLSHHPAETIWRVTLPLLFPFIVSGAIFVFIFSLFNYSVPAVFRVHTYPVEIFSQFSAFYNEGRATSLALPIVGLALMLLLIQRKGIGKRSYVTMGTGSKPQPQVNLGRFKTIALGFVSGIFILSVLLPLMILLVEIGSPDSIEVAWRTSATEITSSLKFAVIAATVVVVLSYFISSALEHVKTGYRNMLDILTFIPFAFPATVIGIGLIHFWNNPFTDIVYKSSLILIIAYFIRFIPYTIRIFFASAQQIGKSLKEAAMIVEKSWVKRVVKVDLPLTLQGLAAGWVIAFVLCMNELGATLLVIPPGNGTLALKIYTLMHYGSSKLVAALSLILIFTNLVVTSAIALGFRRITHHWRNPCS